jgi:hypothetical protein
LFADGVVREILHRHNDIDDVFADLAGWRLDRLHPNLGHVQRRERGAGEFAPLDSTTACVLFRDRSANPDPTHTAPLPSAARRAS